METQPTTPPPDAGLAGDPAPPGGTTGANQPQPVNQRLADILAKKARGEKLNRSEIGYLGGLRRQQKPRVAAVADPNPLFPAAAPAALPDGNPLFEAAEPAAVAGGPVAAVPFDPVRLQKVADSLLRSADGITREFVGAEAAKIPGIQKTEVERYKAAVALQDGNRQLIAEGCEPVVLNLCRWFNCCPETLETTLKSSGLVGGLTLHFLAVRSALKSIKESQAEGRQRAAEAAGAPPP